jgi:hypothetical protein
MNQENKSLRIKNLFMRYLDCWDKFRPIRVGKYKLNDTVISNNGFKGTLKGIVIVYNRIFCWIELEYNKEFFMHHFIDYKDLEG